MDIHRMRLDAPPETLDDPATLADPLLRDVLDAKLIAVVPGTPLGTALRLMIAQQVHHMPVLEGPRCVGLVDEADLLRGLAAEHGPLGRTPLRVRDVARPAPVLPETAHLSDAARAMLASGTDAVLVGTPEHLRGIVTGTDLVRSCAGRAPRTTARRGPEPKVPAPGSGRPGPR